MKTFAVRGVSAVAFMVLCAMTSLGRLTAADYIPPNSTPINNITINSTSNSVRKTLASGYGCWFKASISRKKPCTIWTSNITGGTVTGLVAYERASSQTGSATASTHFTSSTDKDGNLRLKWPATAWSDSDAPTYVLYFNVTGAAGTSFMLNYQLAEVNEVLIGSKNRPYEFTFRASNAPKTQYGTLSETLLEDGGFYAASELTAGNRYYFGITTNTATATQVSLSDPDGGTINLASLRGFSPWNSVETNVLEQVTLFTNIEESVEILTKTTVVSGGTQTTTNETSVVSVTTNEVGAVTTVRTNYVSVVTGGTADGTGDVPLPTITEVSTNYAYHTASVYTNRVYETNVSHIGICREAWKFTPSKSGRYIFHLEGNGEEAFSLCHAVMSPNAYGGGIAFSEPSGTFIPADGALRVELTPSPAQSSVRILYTRDASDPRYTGVAYESGLKIETPTTIRAVAVLDDGDFGDIHRADYYLTRGVIAEGLGLSGLDVSVDDNASDWYLDVETSPSGNHAVRNAAIGDGESVELSMTLRGSGVFSFRWRTSCESGWDGGEFRTNGVDVARISGETAWADGLVSLPVVGTNVLTWVYAKNETFSKGTDCLWMADFSFDPYPVGSRETPSRFEFVDVIRLPGAVYGTETKVMTNGFHCLVSRLEAGRRYYLGVETGAEDVSLTEVIPPEGGRLPLGNLTDYEPWIDGFTNVFDRAGLSDASFAGICSQAWRFVPQTDGDYVFVFSGEGEFTLHDAAMAAWQTGDDLSFSKESGTMFTAGKSLKVRIDCLRDLPCTNLYYTTDGSDPRNGGLPYKSALKIDDTTVVNACLAHDDGTFGDVMSARYYQTASKDQLVEDMEVADSVVRFGDDVAGWHIDVEETPEGDKALRNNAIADDEEVGLTLSLFGKGYFSFNWKVSSEEGWDEGVFYTNGVEVARISGETDWRGEKIVIPVAGAMELKWAYVKDDEGANGEDCLWLADFVLEEVVTLSAGADAVEVARQWFSDYGLSAVATALVQVELAQADELPDAVIARTNALPRSLYESYLCGLDPTDAEDVFRATIEMVEDRPVIEWSPNLGSARNYEILGTASLENLSWHSPTNASDRFFKVRVSMPAANE